MVSDYFKNSTIFYENTFYQKSNRHVYGYFLKKLKLFIKKIKALKINY